MADPAQAAMSRENAAAEALRRKLVAAGFGLPDTAAELRQLLVEWTADIIAPYRDELREQRFRVLAEHPKVHPTYECCAKPKTCSLPHPPECGSQDHGTSRPQWPCRTVQALDADPPKGRRRSG